MKEHLNRIARDVSAANPRHSVEFQSVAKVDDATFKVVMSANPSTSIEEIASEIATQTEGRARMIPDSVARRGEVVVAFVRANTISQPYDANKFQMVTASTAAAVDDGRIWGVVNNGSTKRVILEAGDDLDGIFAARVNARKNVLNPILGKGLAVASFNNGDGVRWVDAASAKAKYGVVFNVGGVPTVVGRDNIPHRISPIQVVASVPRRNLPAALRDTVGSLEERAALSPDKLNDLIGFLAKAWGAEGGPLVERLRELTNKAAQ